MRYRRNDQQEVEPSKRSVVENWPVLSFAKNLLQETLSSEALEPLDLFDRVQLANVVEVVSISRALLEAVSSTSRPQGGKQRSSNDAGLSRFRPDSAGHVTRKFWELMSRKGS